MLTALVLASLIQVQEPSNWSEWKAAVDAKLTSINTWQRNATAVGESTTTNHRQRLEALEESVAKLLAVDAPPSIDTDTIANTVKEAVEAVNKPDGPDWELLGTVIGGFGLNMFYSFMRQRSVQSRLQNIEEKSTLRGNIPAIP